MRPAVARASGPVAPDEAWARYASPARWPQWSPQVRHVDTDCEVLVAGAAGTVRTLGGAVVRFVVLDVDPRARSWSWRIRVGPVGMVLDHHLVPLETGGTRAEVVIHGAWAIARLYRLPATVALHRLVH
jgi:hypothetical protein